MATGICSEATLRIDRHPCRIPKPEIALFGLLAQAELVDRVLRGARRDFQVRGDHPGRDERAAQDMIQERRRSLDPMPRQAFASLL
jgi:hypothetical protein